MKTLVKRDDVLHQGTYIQLCLPEQGMSRAKDILPFLPFGATTLWEWSKKGKFPAPVKVSESMTAWRNSDVIAWLQSFNNDSNSLGGDE